MMAAGMHALVIGLVVTLVLVFWCRGMSFLVLHVPVIMTARLLCVNRMIIIAG